MPDEKNHLSKELDEIDRQILDKVNYSRQPYPFGTLIQQFDIAHKPRERVRNLLWYGYLSYAGNSLVTVYTMEESETDSPYECVLDIVENADKPLIMQEIAYRAYNQCETIDDPQIVYPIIRDLKSRGFVVTTFQRKIKFVRRDLPRVNPEQHPYGVGFDGD